MTIDQVTGCIAVPEIGAGISPDLSRAQFLQTPAFAAAQIFVRNEPWCSYVLNGIPQSQTELSIVFQFHGERLIQLLMTHGAARFGASWADWSEQHELARKAYHERWLIEELKVRRRTFPWGVISSEFDARGGSSTIVISYQNAQSGLTTDI